MFREYESNPANAPAIINPGLIWFVFPDENKPKRHANTFPNDWYTNAANRAWFPQLTYDKMLGIIESRSEDAAKRIGAALMPVLADAARELENVIAN